MLWVNLEKVSKAYGHRQTQNDKGRFFFTNGCFALSQGAVLLESDPPRTGMHQGVSALA